jgi:hypothetical protein
MKVLEREVTVVANVVKRFQHCWPVGGSIEQWAEGLERVICSVLRIFLEMNVFDSFAKDWNPVFWELVLHDVAGIKMNLHVLAGKAINKVHHLHG